MAASGVLVFCVCTASVALAQLADISVKTDAGTFVGFTEEVNLGDRNVTISKFLGIPYAEPPVGDLRFRKSVMKRPLEEPLKVQKFGKSCLQMTGPLPVPPDSDSEDCLFLNIFKPEATEDEGKLAVMVWLYGGGFMMGKADHYIGDALAENGPVIVVTLNYRVTIWGFLSTEDSNAPGNYGLWDQHLAIRWVNQNIAAFGGDPNRVTIFGQSAGAGSATFQGLYPGNKGLFQRMIAQSGTAAARWAIRPNPRLDAEKLAKMVGCETDNVEKMVDCLRKSPMEKLNETLIMSNWDMTMPMAFVPSVDGEFVPKMPSHTMDIQTDDGKDLRELFSSFDLMIGMNSGEGGGAVNPLAGVDTDAENFLPNATFFANTLVPFLTKMMYGDDHPKIISDIVVAEYTDWSDPENPDNIRQQFCMTYCDSAVLANTHRTIKAHASLSEGRSYLYYFNILLHKSFMPRPSWFTGALHGDDLFLMFGNKVDMEIPGMIENRDFLSWEKAASDNMMTLWTNFAKTGNPNKPRDLGVDWLPYTSSRHRYLELSNDVTASRMKERLQERRAELWDFILPAIADIAKCKSAEQSQGTCSREGECPP